MPRKELSQTEKRQVIQQKPNCFICERSINEEKLSDLHFDHIKSLDAGGSNDLTNYAAVHKKCHTPKGTKSLEEFKEELRLDKEFALLSRFTDVTKKFNPANEKLVFKIDYENREIVLGNTGKAHLYCCPNTKLYYFYYPIPRKYLDSDVDVQPRSVSE